MLSVVGVVNKATDLTRRHQLLPFISRYFILHRNRIYRVDMIDERRLSKGSPSHVVASPRLYSPPNQGVVCRIMDRKVRLPPVART